MPTDRRPPEESYLLAALPKFLLRRMCSKHGHIPQAQKWGIAGLPDKPCRRCGTPVRVELDLSGHP